jgi:hypothetical protein
VSGLDPRPRNKTKELSMAREEMISGDENVMGALMNQFGGALAAMRARGGAGRTVTAPQFQAAQIATQVGGTRDNKLRAPLGLGFHTFTAAGVFKFIVEPQEAFRGERLIVEVDKDGAAGVATLVNQITVGTLPQTPSTEFGIPAIMFAHDATDAAMDWQICPAGTKIQIEVETTGGAFAEGDTLTVSVGLYGTWIRG